MKKLISLVLIFLFLTTPLFAQGVKSPGEIGEEISRTIKERPISIKEYADMSVDFLTAILNRILKSGKPLVFFSKEVETCLEASIYEEETWGVVIGYIVSNGEEEKSRWFLGVESKGFPYLRYSSDLFEKLNPSLILHEGNVYFGLSYELKPIKGGE